LSLSLFKFTIIRFTHLQPLVTTSKASLSPSLLSPYFLSLSLGCLKKRSEEEMPSDFLDTQNEEFKGKERNKFLCCGRHNWHCFSFGENIGHLIFLSRCLYYSRVNSLWLLFVQTQYFITLSCFVMVYLVVDLRRPR
jgi:hypothetical protein